MKLQSLRIGNLVKVDNPKYRPEVRENIYKVGSISTYGYDKSIAPDSDGLVGVENIDKPGDSFSQFNQFIIGIPVTKQLLLQAGFEQVPHKIVTLFRKSIGHDKYISIQSIENPNAMAFVTEMASKNIVSDAVAVYNWDYHGPLYFNNLQNLYFALTGEELTF